MGDPQKDSPNCGQKKNLCHIEQLNTYLIKHFKSKKKTKTFFLKFWVI